MSYTQTQQMNTAQSRGNNNNAPKQEWKHGLCDCFNDCGLCCCTCLFPCVTFGQNAEKLGGSCFVYGCLYACIGLPWLFGCLKRQEIRSNQNIDGNACGDCCTHFFCGPCALIQEAQQLKGN
ncbi:8418_t:CDS:2 [Funneliformis caledonium]|uniref:8418_t:CDS:1 n=1 Tax=Funneliformis caledonium TaxID=1117310 RepID=A0A9N9G1I5_9GLOM|nr:8418_t:CDS:2 [Funneliformis caledonium]